jgi:hypothetical protein
LTATNGTRDSIILQMQYMSIMTLTLKVNQLQQENILGFESDKYKETFKICRALWMDKIQ